MTKIKEILKRKKGRHYIIIKQSIGENIEEIFDSSSANGQN